MIHTTYRNSISLTHGQYSDWQDHKKDMKVYDKDSGQYLGIASFDLFQKTKEEKRRRGTSGKSPTFLVGLFIVE